MVIDYPESVDIQDVNDEIWFDIINRTITPKEGQSLKDVLVQNDANSRNLGFMIQRYFENEDLSTKKIRVHYVNSLNQHDVNEVHSIQIIGDNEDVLSFLWLVGNKVCIETGNIQFAIEFYDDDGYELYTKPSTLTIEQGIYKVGVIPEPDDWYILFKKELVDIQNSIDAKNITNLNSQTKINLWELQSGVYTISKSIKLCYAEATESDSEQCYLTRAECLCWVNEYSDASTTLQNRVVKSFLIFTHDLVSTESIFAQPTHPVLIIGKFINDSHISTLSQYYFKDKYNINNWLQIGDGIQKVIPTDIYIPYENEIADNIIKIALDDDYIKNLILNNTDTEMSDTSEKPVQNKVAKYYIDNQIGEIDTALDGILAIQQELIGGEAV